VDDEETETERVGGAYDHIRSNGAVAHSSREAVTKLKPRLCFLTGACRVDLTLQGGNDIIGRD